MESHRAAWTRTALAVTGLFVLTAGMALAQSRSWTAYAESSSPADDAVLVEVLGDLSLSDALSVVRAVSRRPQPDISGLAEGLLGWTDGARAELLLRVALESILALEGEARAAGLSENERTLEFLFGELGRIDSAMTRAAAWKAAAASSPGLRRRLIPEARRGAAAILSRADQEGGAGHGAESGGSGALTGEAGADPELAAEALSFLAYLRVTPDPTLRTFADAIREESRSAEVVRAARNVLSATGAGSR
jgi:hypothetical protein